MDVLICAQRTAQHFLGDETVFVHITPVRCSRMVRSVCEYIALGPVDKGPRATPIGRYPRCWGRRTICAAPTAEPLGFGAPSPDTKLIGVAALLANLEAGCLLAFRVLPVCDLCGTRAAAEMSRASPDVRRGFLENESAAFTRHEWHEQSLSKLLSHVCLKRHTSLAGNTAPFLPDKQGWDG